MRLSKKQLFGGREQQAVAYSELMHRSRNLLCKAASVTPHTIIMYHLCYCRTCKAQAMDQSFTDAN